jgi:hypothetical protein
MVNMGVAQNNELDLFRIEIELFTVQLFHLIASLEHAAIQQEFVTLGGDQVAGTCYRRGCAKKLYLHNPDILL